MNNIFYVASTEIDVFTATETFFLIGCSKCKGTNGSYGTLQIVEPTTMNVLFTVNGEEEERNLAKTVSWNINTHYSEEIWYTTTDGSGGWQSFQTVLAFQNTSDSDWDFWKNTQPVFMYQLPGGDGDYSVFTTDIRNVFFKANSASNLATFQSCPMNEIYMIEDDNWQNRTCDKCRFEAPFSYGYNADTCQSCEVIEPVIWTSDLYVNFFYESACGINQDDEFITDQYTDDDDGKVTEIIIDEFGNEIVVEVTDDGDQVGIIILVAIIIVLVVLGGFLAYKFYYVPKQM